MTGPGLQVVILDIDGTQVADIDATSTMDAMAYFLSSRARSETDHATARDMAAEGARLAAQRDSSWPTAHSEDPTAQFVSESRSPIAVEGVHPLIWQYVARVKP